MFKIGTPCMISKNTHDKTTLQREQKQQEKSIAHIAICNTLGHTS